MTQAIPPSVSTSWTLSPALSGALPAMNCEDEEYHECKQMKGGYEGYEGMRV